MKKTKSEDKVLKNEFEQRYQENSDAPFRTSPDHAHAEQSETVPVVEEKVRIGKRVVETGQVHVSKRVKEELVDVDIPSVHEEVEVERVAVNKHVDSAPSVRYEGDTMIVPVLKEEVVVQKRLVLVEELHITKKKVETHQVQKMPLKKEEVLVTRDRAQPHNPKQV